MAKNILCLNTQIVLGLDFTTWLSDLGTTMNIMNFYLDDSGTRYPSKAVGRKAKHGYDWFAHGGILVKDEDEAVARQLHKDFCTRWEIKGPLHSSEIRSQNESFLWLRSLTESEQQDFYESLYQIMKDAPLVGLACVVDRPGYNHRYSEMYKKEPWLLCKTAFSVVVERAAKFARENGCRLRVYPERCNKAEDRFIKGYYAELKDKGMPFATASSDKYSPLSPEQFRETLYDLKLKDKGSPMAQYADLYLWPMCMGGYHSSNRTFSRLMEDCKLIQCHIPQDGWPTLATKYSCFDLVERKP
jgi:hypothetical protein